MNHIAVVTDSTADIPENLSRQNQIHVVANLVIIDGQSIEDGKGLSRRKFYESLPKMKSLPTTATASSGTYEQLYEKLLQQGFKQILSIHASSFLSGIFNAASLAAQAFNGNVQVVDSQNVSLGLGFQVLAAAEAIKQGASMENVLALLDELRQRMHLVAMLDTLEYVRRSGRVSWARARLGGLLRIKPFVEVRKGQVFSLGEARTYRKGVARLMEMLRDLGTLERLAILHTNAENEARHFIETLAPRLPAAPLVVNVTTVIGTHVGPNGLGFVAIVK
jgi:DegV family protein with EDD domain